MADSRPAESSPAAEQPSALFLLRAMEAGTLTSESVVRDALRRIEAIDRHGPRLHSVIEVNPDALAIAAALDRERKAGRLRGPLHGLPVLIKDNIASGDRMSTSAGSLALDGVRAPRDAHIVKRLREAGAVILGKTNLSEWANIRSTRSVSGWSARGGLTRNPYALDRSTSGSSSGSAAAVAAGFVAARRRHRDRRLDRLAGVDLRPGRPEADRRPAEPRRHRAISHTQDTPGPMTRSVADAALLYAAMAGADRADEATARAPADASTGTAIARLTTRCAAPGSAWRAPTSPASTSSTA